MIYFPDLMWELFALWPAPLGPLWDSHGSCVGVGVARPLTPPWSQEWEVGVDNCSHGSSPNMRVCFSYPQRVSVA